ncbi:MAG TPA: hypothetical protein PK450_10395 [Paracoccaceae bacterium]|nr:hypothetical protein [Paracoccaceae bacterium]
MYHLLSRLFSRKPRLATVEAVPAYYMPEPAGSRSRLLSLTALEQMYGYYSGRGML